ncbi:MAG: MipA/OmpV family protein [Gammaproteobacteria bacterium]|nr:MipA/OmpV family protein [Gammaproteobacteria bacterium]
MPAALAEELLPRKEWGIGAASASLPNYRGSTYSVTYTIPLPYVVYRGEVLKIDRDGVRGRLYETRRVRFDISGGGSVPVSSDKDPLREGMPDLLPSVELGPSMDITLFRPSPDSRVRARFPFRAAAAVGLDEAEGLGWVFHPHLDWRDADFAGGWSLRARLGPLFAHRDFHRYYYDVAPQYATPDRPAYRSDGGYSGTSLSIGTGKRFKRLRIGAFLRYDNLAGAEFADSPLVETEHAFSAGIALVWKLGQSREVVPRDVDVE